VPQQSYDEWLADCIARGKALVERGDIYDTSLTEWFDIERYWESERDLVEINGGCSKCGPCELVVVTSGMGDKSIRCRRTWRECQNAGDKSYE
jgi:hypothetical protein